MPAASAAALASVAALTGLTTGSVSEAPSSFDATPAAVHDHVALPSASAEKHVEHLSGAVDGLVEKHADHIAMVQDALPTVDLDSLVEKHADHIAMVQDAVPTFDVEHEDGEVEFEVGSALGSAELELAGPSAE